MRYMMIIKTTEPSPPPTSEQLAAMGKYNQQLIDAGVFLGGEGLMPSKTGAKVTIEGGKPVVRDGPFAEAKELVGGFWIIRADTLADAVEWARKIPLEEGAEVEIRRVSEIEDFVRDDVSAEALDSERAQRQSGAWPQ